MDENKIQIQTIIDCCRLRRQLTGIMDMNIIIIYKVNMRKTIRLTSNLNNQPQENEQANSIITHRLKPKKKDDMETKSVSNGQKSGISTNQLLSSISTKLHPRSISISSDNRGSTILAQRGEIMVSCLDRLVVPKFSLGPQQQYSLNYEQLRRKAIRRKLKNIVHPLPCIQKNKKYCGDQNCLLKQKWKNKLILESKDFFEAQKLKNFIQNLKQQTMYDKQIDKDVSRSFPDKMSPKTKLTLYHTSAQKNAITQALRTVLKMLAVCDTEVGYVQGMNLFAAVIVSHMKQVQLSFLFIKQVMKYGNMRKMYVYNFKNMKQLCSHLLHRHIKILMNDLYEVFMQSGVTIQLFMPFYLSMFACVVDYNFMPSVIDEFMTKGFLFLDKLMLSMLCYLKEDFLQSDPVEVACKLGASYIRSCQIPWDQVINLVQAFQLN